MKNKSLGKILIIDDDHGIVDATKMLLELAGYQVICNVNNPNIKQIISQQPDLILLDLWLTSTDGRQLGRQLRQNNKTKNIPILFFSASRNVQKDAGDAEADDYIAKPYETEVLLAKIKNLLSNRD